MRVRHTAPVAGLLCLLVAGCTTTSRGDPAPATTTEVSTVNSTAPSSEEDDLPSHGAPKVDDPLDTTRFQQDPCLALTAEQAQDELNLPPQGEPEEIALGKGCEWFNPDTRGRVIIGFLTGNPRGLSGFYDAKQQGKYAYFNELPPIEGYPAIAIDIEDRRPRGICIVDVGVTDQFVFDVYLQLSQANVGNVEPCELAAEVAGKALRTMKEGA
jgi:hypothetical protein